jgi:hypothetical protein
MGVLASLFGEWHLLKSDAGTHRTPKALRAKCGLRRVLGCPQKQGTREFWRHQSLVTSLPPITDSAEDAEWAEALVLPWEAAALGCQMAVWELESALLWELP